MSVQLDIQLADDLSESIEEPPPRHLLQQWAQAAWQGAENEQPVLSLRIVSSAESQQLNHDYRGKNKPTNVLSFPMNISEKISGNVSADMPAELLEAMVEDFSQTEMMLGDLAICADVVNSEANQQGKSLQSHWAHMVIHGMLHLQGFDHIDDAQAEEMESLEIQIMQQLGFSDPYSNQTSLTEQTSMTEQKP